MIRGKGLQNQPLAIGIKQTLKMVERDKTIEVYVAVDADLHLTSRIISICEQKGVKLTYAPSMVELGKACGIQVGAAMVAVVEGEK